MPRKKDILADDRMEMGVRPKSYSGPYRSICMVASGMDMIQHAIGSIQVDLSIPPGLHR